MVKRPIIEWKIMREMLHITYTKGLTARLQEVTTDYLT